jgi:DNA mismatch endonuclease (patch repair protein)
MDKISKEKRSKNMSKIRSKNTKPELLVRSIIHQMGYRFRLHVPDLPGKPDIVLPRHRKIIFVHGCFWHQHKNCKIAHKPKSRISYWQPKLNANKKRHRKHMRTLKSLGWNCIVVWECETKNLNKMKAKLQEFLGNKRNI